MAKENPGMDLDLPRIHDLAAELYEQASSLMKRFPEANVLRDLKDLWPDYPLLAQTESWWRSPDGRVLRIYTGLVCREDFTHRGEAHGRRWVVLILPDTFSIRSFLDYPQHRIEKIAYILTHELTHALDRSATPAPSKTFSSDYVNHPAESIALLQQMIFVADRMLEAHELEGLRPAVAVERVLESSPTWSQWGPLSNPRNQKRVRLGLLRYLENRLPPAPNPVDRTRSLPARVVQDEAELRRELVRARRGG